MFIFMCDSFIVDGFVDVGNKFHFKSQAYSKLSYIYSKLNVQSLFHMLLIYIYLYFNLFTST